MDGTSIDSIEVKWTVGPFPKEVNSNLLIIDLVKCVPKDLRMDGAGRINGPLFDLMIHLRYSLLDSKTLQEADYE